MVRRTWIAIPTLVVGVLLALSAGAQDTRDTRAELADLLLAEDTTRGQMAEGVLRALEVAEFQPPDCVPGEETFDDVPATSPFCPWIEELVRRGITVGCGDDKYCRKRCQSKLAAPRVSTARERPRQQKRCPEKVSVEIGDDDARSMSEGG